ncbi:MAG: hypothetical protein V3R99_03510 [Thermoguttaceae bacterium]
MGLLVAFVADEDTVIRVVDRCDILTAVRITGLPTNQVMALGELALLMGHFYQVLVAARTTAFLPHPGVPLHTDLPREPFSPIAVEGGAKKA